MHYITRVNAFIQGLIRLRIIRAIFVGGIALVAQATVFECVSIVFHVLPPSTGTLVAAEFGVVTNFFLNNKISFGDRAVTSPLIARFLRFHLVVMGSIAIQFISVFITERFTGDSLIIQVVYATSIVVGFAWNYLWYKLWVWKHHPSESSSYRSTGGVL